MGTCKQIDRYSPIKYSPCQVTGSYNCRYSVFTKDWFKGGPFKKCLVVGESRCLRQTAFPGPLISYHKGSVVHDWSQPSRGMPDQGEDYTTFELYRTYCSGWVNQHWCSETCQGISLQYKSIKEDHGIKPCTPKSLTFFYGRAVLGCDHNGVLTCFMVYARIFFICLARVGSCLYQ